MPGSSSGIPNGLAILSFAMSDKTARDGRESRLHRRVGLVADDTRRRTPRPRGRGGPPCSLPLCDCQRLEPALERLEREIDALERLFQMLV